MEQDYLFEVGYKPGVTDPVGQGLKHDIVHLGLGRVKNVLSAQLYKVSGQLSAEERKRIANDLLCDPILNELRDPSPQPSPRGRGRGEAAGEGKPSLVIDVWFKPGVTDVVSDSVQKGIRDLNIKGVEDVRTGMRYHLEGITRREVAEKIAAALLANPQVHESTIHAN